MKKGNILVGESPAAAPGVNLGEVFENLIEADNVKIERIVSGKGYASPAGFWYDQEVNEWVMVVQGSAGIGFADRDEVVELGRGDYLNIAARVKHRVVWTDSEVETVWLVVRY